jgi:ABC-type transport system substrate-binding protein
MADPSVVGAVAREVVEHYGDRIMDHPVGTGPYRLDIWRRSSRIELVRNPTYREEYFPARAPAGDADARALVDQLHGRRLPIVDRFVISPIEESQPRWLAFLNGEHDLVERMPRDLTPLALAGKAMTPVLARKHVQLYRVPEIDVTIIIYNMDDPVVGGYTPVQVALRRALSLSVDVDGLIAGIYKYQAFPAQTVVMPGTYGFDPARHTENGDYDPGRANALLDIYGYRRGADGWRSRPDGSPLEVEMSTEPDQRSRLMNEIIKKSYNAIGVQVRFKIAKWPENLKMVQESQYQIWFLGLTASGPDSIPSLRQMYGPALGGDDLCRMKLPEFDRLLLSADELPDGPARLALVDRMTALEVAYAPLKAVTHRYKIALAYPWVIGYRARPFIHDWWRYIDVDVDLQARHSR